MNRETDLRVSAPKGSFTPLELDLTCLNFRVLMCKVEVTLLGTVVCVLSKISALVSVISKAQVPATTVVMMLLMMVTMR